MKSAQVFHNPGAGNEAHTEAELTGLLEANGYHCSYISTKEKGWKKFGRKKGIFVIAGGDGTVRKVVKEMFRNELLDIPVSIGLIPLGTANNIARSLSITGEANGIIDAWKNGNIKTFDVGMVDNLPDAAFFLESFGFGIFPYLMQEMKKLDEDAFSDPDSKLKKALEVLDEILYSYEARSCELEVDGTDHSGKFILAEVMNTRSIGPNLNIAPHADPGDGEFEVILVSEKQKDKFAGYISGKMEGLEAPHTFHTLKGKNIKISWQGTHVHVDDQIIKMQKGKTVKITMKEGLLEFLTP